MSSFFAKQVLVRVLTCLGFVGLVSCGEDAPPSLFDANEPSKPAPVITSIVPPDSALAGVGEMIINGENFSTQEEENFVFFNGERAEVVAASETQLTIKTPNLVGNAITIKIAVHGAELFSNEVVYRLVPAVQQAGKILEGDIVYGIAVGPDETLYAFVRGRTNEIKRILPDGTTTTFASTTFLRANAMKMGSGDTLYVAPSGRIKKISTFAPDGTEATYVSLGPPTLGEPVDLDFDADGNLWVVGGSIVFLVKPDRSVSQVANLPVLLRTVRVFEGFLYVAGRNPSTGEEKIWRSPIQEDGLGQAEVVLDVAAAGWLEGANVNALTFSEDGEMILGTTHANAGFIYRGGDDQEPLYPGLLEPEIYALNWGPGQVMYAVRHFENESTMEENAIIYAIKMGKNGAPTYGRR